MFNKLIKKAKKLMDSKAKDQEKAKNNNIDSNELHNSEHHPLSVNIEDNLRELNAVFDRASDVVIRQIKLNTPEPIAAVIIHVEGLVDTTTLNDNLLKNIMIDSTMLPSWNSIDIDNVFPFIKERLLSAGQVSETRDVINMVNKILDGDIALILDGTPKALILSAKGWETRDVSEPDSESVVRGPRDGFTETLRTNTSLIRRRVKSTRLKTEIMKVGVLTKTDVAILYIDGIVFDGLVDEIKTRLERIDTDSILDSGMISEFIEDDSFTIFPLIRATERPDSVAGALLEGQAAIIVDNSPFVLVTPATFPQFLQSSEDYYNSWFYATFLRILRFVALNIALLLPSLYVAIVTFHQEMIPTALLITIADARAGVPFPAFVEAIIMELTFEILREAGVRLPKQVGQAISIVGALVIGDAAVSAGLVSPAMVIIVALTAISSFTIVNLSGANAIRMLRFPIIILAGSLGLYGIMVALMAILIHLCTLRSFGIPYLSPLTPLSLGDLKDSVIRFPRWALSTRPRLIGYKEPVRQGAGLKPQPPKKGTGQSDQRGGKSE